MSPGAGGSTLSGGAVAGIVIGVIVAVILIVASVLIFVPSARIKSQQLWLSVRDRSVIHGIESHIIKNT